MSNSRQHGGALRQTDYESAALTVELRAPLTDSNQSLPSQASRTARRPDFYLRARIRYILANLDSIKPSRLRGKVQDMLRELVHELRNSKGASFWPLSFAAGCLLFLAGLVWFNRPHPLIFSPENNHTVIRVLRQYNDLDWQIQRVVDSVQQTPEVRHFDEKPTFEIGYTLTKLEVNDRGKFWSIKHIDPYFVALRDFTGWPIIPANCTNALGKPVVCDGVPRWEEK